MLLRRKKYAKIFLKIVVSKGEICYNRAMKNATFHILPLYTLMPVHDVNVSVVNFGFQGSDKEHYCPPQVKTEHVLQYIVEGEGFLELGGKEYRLHAGDLFYLPKNELLSYRAEKNNPYRYYWIGLDGVSAEKLLARAGLRKKSPVAHYDDEEIVKIYQRIGDALAKNDFAGYVEANGEAYKLLALLLAKNGENENRLKTPSAECVDRAISYIKTHFSEDIGIKDVARAAGLQNNYFSALFRKHTGSPPVEYLLRYRIFQAERMLAQGLFVTETAFACGFNSLSHFSYQFKKLTGVSPREYRLKQSDGDGDEK